MDSLKQKDGVYVLPILYVFRFRWFTHLVFALLGALIIGLILIPSGGDTEKTYFNFGMIFIGIVWAIFWVVMSCTKSYLKVTDEYLEYKDLFSTKVLQLKDIDSIDIYFRRAEFMGIVTSDRKAKTGVLHNTFRSKYSLSIPASLIVSDINFDKLRLTILAASKTARGKSNKGGFIV